jgi:hypothetical protein
MRHESGNALWFILLAIALVTALTVTITSSSDQTEQSGDIERYRIQASEMLNYSKSLQEAVNRMSLRGIGENEMSFEDSGLTTSYAHGNCSSGDCKIFDKSGGGVSYEAPDTSWLDKSESASSRYGEWFFTADTCVANVSRGSTDCDSDAAANEELLIVLPYVKKGLCIEINYILGHKDGSDAILLTAPEQSSAAIDLTTPYLGAFGGDNLMLLDDNSYLNAKKTGCYLDNGIGAYMFYYTLIGR